MSQTENNIKKEATTSVCQMFYQMLGSQRSDPISTIKQFPIQMRVSMIRNCHSDDGIWGFSRCLGNPREEPLTQTEAGRNHVPQYVAP